ncbi:MAG: UDP-N-acetylmuramoyl-L-alanine--D-glutamate ligase [Clostridiales Family XIII bacterium]|jgi:UDP-N-acetylmuramoylalanine--D-glutamate ligase|nr:UDP-N-acetylmuramoyl-L-alanine--D-glutamate ligase [Clostridiales Family XIII bacterium]
MGNHFDYRNILIVGLGKSGEAAFDALAGRGARLAVYDAKDIAAEAPAVFRKILAAGARVFMGGADVPDEGWDLVVPSPGVPLTLPFIERARARGAKVLGELELAYLLGHGSFVAITGTNGKTTTTTLVAEIFRAGGRDAVAAGNIGNPVLTEALAAEDGAWLITEVSSFQLDTTEAFRPAVSVFLNLTPDHMDRHHTMEGYRAAKAKIFARQTGEDAFVYNADDAFVRPLAQGCRARPVPFSRTRALPDEGAAFVQDGMIVILEGGAARPVIPVGALRIPGAHNLENALAAAAASRAAGVSLEAIAAALGSFAGVEHRLELVRELSGVRFVNDSKGTNPDASIKALEAVEPGIILIAGGYDKHADFTEFLTAGKGRVKALLLLGATAAQIESEAQALGYADIRRVADMAEAVRTGYALAEEGDTVLLSPACASWDMYDNFEQRGDHFRKEAEALA